MPKNDKITPAVILGALLAAGIAFAGYCIGDALLTARTASRYVTVKGLAERNVPADLAVWPITITETGNALSDVQKRLDEVRDITRAFLGDAGLAADTISESPPRITDYYAQGYTGRDMPQNRYKADITITVRTPDVERVKRAMEASGTLVKRGVVLADNYGSGTEFLFTQLNTIKPAMIAEATKNARKAAEQFARDSGSTVGSIRRAQQGLFTIRDRDINSPDLKIVRVVTTIEYFLVSP